MLDDAENLIVKQLIKNPRLSDNQIAKNTKLSVMTVNRKRKSLEAKGLLLYFTALNTSDEGTGIFNIRQLYIIKFKTGLTREQYLEGFTKNPNWRYSENIVNSFLGEKDGHLALILMMEAKTQAELVEIFNGKIILELQKAHGTDAVEDIITTRIDMPVRLFHNYLPLYNMKEGHITEDWPEDYIFADRPMEHMLKKKNAKKK